MLLALERYVLVRTLAAVLAALAVIAAIIMLIDTVELSRDVGVRAEISFAEVLGLTLLKSPALILQLLPFVFLFGVLGAFVNLNRKSELIAMRAAGVSAWRFIFPAAGAAFLVGVITVTALNPLATLLNRQFETVRAQLLESYLNEPDEGGEEVWLQQGDGRTQVIINAIKEDEAGLRLRDVTASIYLLSSGGERTFSRRIEAKRAVMEGGAWRLIEAREAGPGGAAVRYDNLSLPTTLDLRSALNRLTSSQSVPFWSLPGMIARSEEAGVSATGYRLRLHQLLATPVMFAAMSILAAGFSLRLMRLGGLAGLAGSGVALGFVFFFFDQLCSAMGRAGILPPFAAAWAPPLIALLSGLTLLCYTEDG
jgi:lipopolysaccharide export system permease protein